MTQLLQVSRAFIRAHGSAQRCCLSQLLMLNKKGLTLKICCLLLQDTSTACLGWGDNYEKHKHTIMTIMVLIPWFGMLGLIPVCSEMIKSDACFSILLQLLAAAISP